MVNHFQQSVSEAGTCAVLYFFCDHRDPGKQSFHDLLRILVKQLLDGKHECFAEIKAWRKEKNIDSSAVPKPLGNSDYVDVIRRLCAKWDFVNLIIDAVDECADLNTFMSGIASIVANCNINLLLTSRHDVELVRAIEPIAKYKVPVEENMRDDIHSFLVAQLNKRTTEGTLKLRDKSLEDIIAGELEKKADGMYVCLLLARHKLMRQDLDCQTTFGLYMPAQIRSSDQRGFTQAALGYLPHVRQDSTADLHSAS